MSIQSGNSPRDEANKVFNQSVSVLRENKKTTGPLKKKPIIENKPSESDSAADEAKQEAVSFLSNAVKQSSAFSQAARKKLPKRELGHTPRREVDKDLIEKNNEIIDEVYGNYEGDSLDELAQLLTERGLHVHMEKDAKDRVTPVARVFYHDPVIAIIREKDQILLDGFFHDLKVPKPEPEEENIDETKKKRLFGKKRR